MEDDLLNAFESFKGRRYRKKATLNRLLNQMGLKNKKLRKTCIEAGLIGFIQETILKAEQVLISDRAGQFAILDHAGCWVHMERPFRDSLMTLKQTCYRLGENFWKYLQAWFRKRPIGLADRIRERYRSATLQS